MSEPLYKNLVPVRSSQADLHFHHRNDCPHLQRITTVPIASVEFGALAGALPIVWHRGEAGLEPLALTGLLPGFGTLLATGTIADSIPLLILSYPFGAPQYDGTQERVAVMLDQPPVAADAVAHAVFDDKLALRPEADTAIRALYVYLSDRQRTVALSQALDEAGGLTAWRNRIVFDDAVTEIGDLWVCKTGFEATEAYGRLIAQHGPHMAMLIECHRASLQHFGRLARRLSGSAQGGQH